MSFRKAAVFGRNMAVPGTVKSVSVQPTGKGCQKPSATRHSQLVGGRGSAVLVTSVGGPSER